jgi:hypothetical protein
MPMTPAGMLGRADSDSDKGKEGVTHARIVVDADGRDPRQMDA